MTFTPFPRVPGIREPGVDALMRFGSERQTGIVGTALTLANVPVVPTLDLFKNGMLLDPVTDYTLAGKAVTLGSAAIAADVFQARYHFRQSN